MSETVVTASGDRLSEVQIRHYLRINIIAGSIGVTWFAVVMGMPLTLLFEALGASGVQIGAVITIMNLSMLMQLPGALLVNRLKSRKPIWATVNIIARGMWVFVPLLFMFYRDQPLLIAQVVLVMVAISTLMSNFMSAAWFSWLADFVPESLRARFWGTRQAWTMASYLAVTWAAGYVLDLFGPRPDGGVNLRGFEWLIVITGVLAILDIVVHMAIPEPPMAPIEKGVSWLRQLVRPLTYPDFRRQTIAMGIYTFAVGLVSLGVIFLKKDYGVSYSQLAAITIVANFGTILVGCVGGYLVDRIGGRAFGATMLLLAPLLGLAWFFVQDYETNLLTLFDGRTGQLVRYVVAAMPETLQGHVEALVLPQVIWVLLVVNFFAGILYGGMGVCQMSMVGALAPKEGRTVAMAVHWCVVGLIGSAGSLIAGKVMDHYAAHPLNITLPTGTRLAFHHVLVVVHMVILWGVALPLQLRVRRRSGEPDFALALSRLMITSPLRAVTNIYTMSSAVTSHRRAAAARTLGEKRTALAVSDLIEKLDDPSADVREEAVVALGRIGSNEAVDALLQKLDDPNASLDPQIARALRETPTPRSVDALVRKLDDPDRETRAESARTLGAIGDQRAVPPLMELLETSDDAKVVSASGEALARIGVLAAVYELLPRMKETRNPVLKRSLAVAIGDLLGEREGFYKVLIREEQARGAEVQVMLRELRRTIAEMSSEREKVMSARLLGRLREIQEAYESEKRDRCAEALFDLGVALAEHKWGLKFGGDAASFLPDLAWRDESFGAGMWYLTMLHHSWDTAKLGPLDDVDVLLGLFFLCSHGETQREPKPARPRGNRNGRP